jgi:hypothetical protein
MELKSIWIYIFCVCRNELVISKGVIYSQGSYKCTPQMPVPTMLSMKMLSIFIESIVGTGAWEFLRAMVLQVVDTQNQLVRNMWSDTNQK